MGGTMRNNSGTSRLGHRETHATRPGTAPLVLLLGTLLLAACGGIPSVQDPVGKPVLPDLVPEPPVDLRVQYEGDKTTIRFSSTLVNVGEGEFILRGTRKFDEWLVEQEVVYSDSGEELSPTDAVMVWGGDGHNHWHIQRVATYTLYRLDDNSEIVGDDIALPDAKVGFCFYDHSRVSETGPADAVYSSEECGDQDDNEIRMGMSRGWSDVYGFALPGQSIDITDLVDDSYRVLAVADPQGWFAEASHENNTTWIDFDLVTRNDNRFAVLTEVGPNPSESD